MLGPLQEYAGVDIRLNSQARLLPYLADGSFRWTFMHIHPTAWQAPAPPVTSIQQQNLPRVVEHGSIRAQLRRNDPNLRPERLKNTVIIDPQ